MNNFSLEGYKVLELIGQGAFSNVYRVKDRKLGSYFAAKRLLDKCESLEDASFCSEVKLIKTVPSHQNLLNICGLVHENNCLTLIMELMDMSLHEFIQMKKRPMSEKRAQIIFLQIVRGLDHLHRNGIFHRDIKPENILMKLSRGVDRKEIAQLADFGTIARIADSPPFTSYIATRWYRAPECLLTMGYYGSKMDIWAVGCCYYEMLTRKPLFPGDTETEMLNLIHDLLGTPSKSILRKFNQIKVGYIKFSKRYPKDFRLHLPLLSTPGIDVLKKTIVYHPEQRICSSKLLNHIYFEGIAKQKKLSSLSLSSQSLNVGSHRTSKSICCSPGASVWSGDSFSTSKTVHYFPSDKQAKKKRTLERLWGMHEGPEKQNLFRQIGRSLAS